MELGGKASGGWGGGGQGVWQTLITIRGGNNQHRERLKGKVSLLHDPAG